ncbi:MAG: VWA domain-containing protein [Actinobacteria bacterium]|nr:VWA domain-containing protein [Actinomycetota bacterium]
MNDRRFPFAAVVGQDEVKLALVLAALDPAIGGVLLRGQKGSAKTTLARGLAALLAADAPFVELPVGATEDRVVGALDVEAALTQGEHRFRPGLLAAAHGGVLYVDEVNLLPDHLVDVLLDVAVSGVNRVERDGLSHTHPSRFVLVGSMNPEEGDLRPQLLDRFGLAVDVTAPDDPGVRAEIVRRRLAFDRGDVDTSDDLELRGRLADARPAALPSELIDVVSRLCVSVGAEGLRADLVICRAAGALAGWEGRHEATVDDVRRVAPLALAHRRRRSPLDDAGIDQQEVDDALEQATQPQGPDSDERVAAADEPPSSVVRLSAARHPTQTETAGRRSTVEGPRGRHVGDRTPQGAVGSMAVTATAQAAAVRRALDPDDDAALRRTDLREAVREQRAGNLVVLAVDASGSMGAERRMEAVKGAVLGLLVDAYQRRDRVALVTFRGDEASVALRPTSSVEVARARLAELPTGGRTPLAAGIATAVDLAAKNGDTAHRPLLVLVSDGRATAATEGVDPVHAANEAASAVRRRGIDAVVLDAEDGPTRLGLARGLAEAMGARYLPLSELSAAAVEGAIREATR